jgi:hypothetical protein
VTGLKFLYKAAAAGAPPDAIAPANRSGSSSLQQNPEYLNVKGLRFFLDQKISLSKLRKILQLHGMASVWGSVTFWSGSADPYL